MCATGLLIIRAVVKCVSRITIDWVENGDQFKTKLNVGKKGRQKPIYVWGIKQQTKVC